MPRVLPEHIAAGWHRVDPLNLKRVEELADSVFKNQPNLLASILVLPKFGVSNAHLEVALKILFICHEAVLATGVAIKTITEDDQERCLARVTGRARFLEGLDSASAEKAVADQVHTHPEPQLLALAHGMLQDSGITSVHSESEKYLVLGVLNVVETISYALHA